MSIQNRAVLHESLIQELRRFIAGTILFNQKVADRFGLRLTDMQCLNVLDLLGPVTPGKLVECTGLSTGGVTVMLDRLEKSGFIRREPNPADRRSLLIRMNARKMKKVHLLYAEINVQLDRFLGEMSPSDLKSVVGFFTQMNAMRSGGLK